MATLPQVIIDQVHNDAYSVGISLYAFGGGTANLSNLPILTGSRFDIHYLDWTCYNCATSLTWQTGAGIMVLTGTNSAVITAAPMYNITCTNSTGNDSILLSTTDWQTNSKFLLRLKAFKR